MVGTNLRFTGKTRLVNNIIDLRDVGVPSVSSRGWGCVGGSDHEVSLIRRVVYGDHIFLFWRM
jgi:hypothetical protein